MKKFILPVLLMLIISGRMLAQDDLLGMLQQSQKPEVKYSTATFKTTRIINGQSVETINKGALNFIIGHRFGAVNGGAKQLFGIDNATMRMGFEYGITNRLNVGIGRSSFEKTFDGSLKYKLLRQSSGAKKMPFSMTLFAAASLNSNTWPYPERKNYFTSRLYYSYQILLARKINDRLSLQLSPSLIHRNLVTTNQDKNDVFAIGAGGRCKLSRSLSLNAEYFYIVPGQIVSVYNGNKVRNTLSIGIDLETGGHIFQLHFTNSRGMAEKQFITETTGNWGKGDFHFGFNVNRLFNVISGKKIAEMEEKRNAKKEAKANNKSN